MTLSKYDSLIVEVSILLHERGDGSTIVRVVHVNNIELFVFAHNYLDGSMVVYPPSYITTLPERKQLRHVVTRHVSIKDVFNWYCVGTIEQLTEDEQRLLSDAELLLSL